MTVFIERVQYERLSEFPLSRGIHCFTLKIIRYIRSNMSISDSLPYRVGGLLYTPATRRGIADKLEAGAFPCLSSLAFCLEDSIRDEALPQAEVALRSTLREIAGRQLPPERMPLLFVRVRSPMHLRHVHELLGDAAHVLTGYIFPKFDLSNADAYVRVLQAINASGRRFMAMPILESAEVARLDGRAQTLGRLREIIDGVKESILNVRVGGNDFCRLYGIRRPVDRSIYDIGVVRDILSDIINVFASDYVVSGPVWEYFGDTDSGDWARGLRNELELDRLNGFIGKTAIHPSQLPIIQENLKVSITDFEDARSILGWTGELGVSRGSGSRMNELNCHRKWAEQVKMLVDIYGIREEHW